MTMNSMSYNGLYILKIQLNEVSMISTFKCGIADVGNVYNEKYIHDFFTLYISKTEIGKVLWN